MTKFMRKRAHAGYFIRITHHNKRMRTLRTPGECTMAFALIWINIHPAILETATADSIYIFLTHGCQAVTDQFNTLLIRYAYFLLRDRSPHIIICKFFEP